MLAKGSNDFSTPIGKNCCRSISCVSECLSCISAKKHSVLSCSRSLTRPTIALDSCETGAAHLSLYPRRDRARHSLAGFEGNRGTAQADDDRLGQLLLSGASQQGLQCGRYTRPPEAASVVMRQTQRAAAGIQTISGSVSSLRVWLGIVTTPDREPSVGANVSIFREPDAGNLPVRFDERERETEPSQTVLRQRGESHV